MIGLPYIAGAGVLLFVAGFGGGCHAMSVRKAKEIATKDARIEALDTVLADVQAQRAKLQDEVKTASPAADRVITVALPSWSRDTNAIAIGAGCEAAVQFTRDRLPIMKAHRQMEAVP